MFAQHGFPVVDADQVARDNMASGSPVLQAVADEFGADILDANGELRRSELARRAFANEENTEKLNRITHPAIRKESERRMQIYAQQGYSAVVYDMPLLLELGLDDAMDITVVVHAPEDIRVQRLITSRGMAEVDVRNRMQRQLDDETRKARADILIDNAGTTEALRAQVQHALSKIDALIARC